MPLRCGSAGFAATNYVVNDAFSELTPMTDPVTTRCEAKVTVKGKPCRCDQPATADRSGRAVCLKHYRAVWIEYVKPR
jgi:hypothetical protein